MSQRPQVSLKRRERDSGPLRFVRVCAWCWLLVVVFLGGHQAYGAEVAISKEYQLKAAFIYNFTKFVEWPQRSTRAGDSPFLIGVLGRNPFGGELEKVLRDRRINGRVFVVRIIASPDEAASVDLLFVPAGEEQRLAGRLPALATAGVLTVGESGLFATRGGTITFTTEGDKVRFGINLLDAGQDGLKFSAQLLKLASAVQRKS